MNSVNNHAVNHGGKGAENSGAAQGDQLPVQCPFDLWPNVPAEAGGMADA
jgi:hypothetical protein